MSCKDYLSNLSSEFQVEFTKAADVLKKNGVEPLLEYGGYSILVSPTTAKCIKGAMNVCEAKQTVLIRNILVNEKKRLVTVVFADGGHEIIACQKGDHFDVKIGVALAISQHLFGSKNKFHKEIDKKTKFVENKSKDTKGKK